MHWEPCEVCGEDIIIFDLTKTTTGYRCFEGCYPKESKNSLLREKSAPPKEEVKPKDPLQEKFGFDKPEDGSQRRFVFSQAKQGIKPPWMEQSWAPWARHRFWWLLHNAVAHPLIAVAPRESFFRLHDWTSRKMHGK